MNEEVRISCRAQLVAPEHFRAAPGVNFVRYDASHPTVPAKKRAQRGGASLKAILYTMLLLIVVYVCFKIVPPYVSEYELNDKMQEQARYAVVNRYSDEQIRDNIFKVVQDLDIETIRKEDIRVVATQSLVRISVNYTVPVNFMVYSTELHFSPSSENRSIM